jgi:hypothetical protein
MKHAMRRLAEALLLALFLVAVQTAVLTHDHDQSAPAGVVAQGCDFCAGGHSPAAAPPPASGAPDAELDSPGWPATSSPAVSSRFRAAHRSRAPPSFRSS